MKVLVVDVGGNNVKISVTGHEPVRKFSSGPELTPKLMVAGVIKAAKGGPMRPSQSDTPAR